MMARTHTYRDELPESHATFGEDSRGLPPIDLSESSPISPNTHGFGSVERGGRGPHLLIHAVALTVHHLRDTYLGDLDTAREAGTAGMCTASVLFTRAMTSDGRWTYVSQ